MFEQNIKTMMSYVDCSDHWHVDSGHVSVSKKTTCNILLEFYQAPGQQLTEFKEPAASIIHHPSSIIHHLSPIIHHLSYILRHLSSNIYQGTKYGRRDLLGAPDAVAP